MGWYHPRVQTHAGKECCVVRKCTEDLEIEGSRVVAACLSFIYIIYYSIRPISRLFFPTF